MAGIQLSGLASGMDTQSIVNDLMKAERIRVDRFEQDNTYNTWTQEAYNTVNKDTADFIMKTKNNLGMSTTTSTGLTLDSADLGWMKTSSSSNDSAFTVTALSSAVNSSHTIEVSQLAKGVNVVGSQLDITGSTNLRAIGVGAAGTIELTVGGTAKTVSYNETDSIDTFIGNLNAELGGAVASFDDVNNKINLDFSAASGPVNITSDSGLLTGSDAAFETGLSMGVDYSNAINGSAMKISSEATLADIGIAVDSSVTFEKSNGEQTSISYAATDTISSFLDKINNSSAGINASFDSNTGRLFMSTDKTGAEAQIKVVSDSGNLFTGGTAKLGTADLSVAQTGQDAAVKLDGADFTFSSNQFEVNGMSFNVKSTTTKEESINIGTNTDEIVDRIKTFVEDYNKLIDGMNKKLSEKEYRDFKPLTKDQKEAMSEEEVKLWETKAKSGLLRSDDIVQRMISTTRAGLYEGVKLDSGGTSYLYDIGITTADKSGKLKIDEDKLRTAISQDPDKVVDTLYKRPDSAIVDDAEKRANTGVLYRMVDDMVDGMKEIINKAGTGDNKELYRSVQSSILLDFVKSGSQSLIDKDIDSVKLRIERENSRLASVEERYWKQFTAMEKAISNMNQQSAWIGSQMG